MYDDIRYEVDDPVAVITLNRPASMNAWMGTMDTEIADALKRVSADKSVVGIVVTGEGRGFCAGADMTMLTALTEGDDRDQLIAVSGGVSRHSVRRLRRPLPLRHDDRQAGDRSGQRSGRGDGVPVCALLRPQGRHPRGAVPHGLLPTGSDRRMGFELAVAASCRAIGCTRSAVLIASGLRRGSAGPRSRQLPRAGGRAARFLPHVHREPRTYMFAHLVGDHEAAGVRAVAHRSDRQNPSRRR